MAFLANPRPRAYCVRQSQVKCLKLIIWTFNVILSIGDKRLGPFSSPGRMHRIPSSRRLAPDREALYHATLCVDWIKFLCSLTKGGEEENFLLPLFLGAPCRCRTTRVCPIFVCVQNLSNICPSIDQNLALSYFCPGFVSYIQLLSTLWHNRNLQI